LCVDETAFLRKNVYIIVFLLLDKVFGETFSTEQIYNTLAKPIVDNVMEGFNGMY